MAINKVVFGNDTLIDLTEDSVSASNLLEGETAHDRSGTSVTGTAKQGHVVQNASGTDLIQRAKLQFIGATVSDDSVGDKTVVNMPSATQKSTMAQFDTVNGGVLDKCLVTFSPVQSGSGDPAPDNVRPISGHTEVDVERVGKNFSSVTNETFTYRKTINDYIPAGTYRASGIITTDATNDPVIIFYDADDNDIGRFSFTANTGSRVNSSTSLTLAKDAVKYILQSGSTIATSTTKTATFKDIQIEKGETTTSFESYQKLSVQIPLGDTYYGGTLDVVSGELVVDKGIVDITQLNNLRYASSYVAFVGDVSDSKIGSLNFACSSYGVGTFITGATDCAAAPNGKIYRQANNAQFFIKDARYTDVATFISAMAGQKLVYELATPVTVQLTPQQITALVGQNNISAPLNGQEITDAVYKELFTFDDVQQNVVRERTQAQYDAMSAADKAKGVIEITDANAKPLFDTQVRRSNGDGTVADALDVELNVDVQYTNSNITIAEYFRYHRFGKMVVVDIGGMKTSNTAEQVIATSNLPIMRTRPVAVMFSNQTGSNQIRGFLYGAIGYRSFTVAIPTANTTMYAQFIYFTD